MKAVLDFLDLGTAGRGAAVGVMPELFLVDARKPFQTGLGEDAAVDGKQALDIHRKLYPVIAEQFPGNAAVQAFAGLDKIRYRSEQIDFDFADGRPRSDNPVDLIEICRVSAFQAFDRCMKRVHGIVILVLPLVK